ncbi:MAG: hypothetical protein HZB26_06995 [Candidatus Hydrogenedentes bacterium]|nr:hypothetical protein [Candidatus Hydrogenedentota bacterium]
MQSGKIVIIALIAGLVGAGFVWFSWSLFENVLAGVKRKKPPKPADAPGAAAESKPSKPDKK